MNLTTTNVEELNKMAMNWHEFNEKVRDKDEKEFYDWLLIVSVAFSILLCFVAATIFYLKHKKIDHNRVYLLRCRKSIIFCIKSIKRRFAVIRQLFKSLNLAQIRNKNKN